VATPRQLELDTAVRRAVSEFGGGISADRMIAIAAERTQADPREIIEAVEEIRCPEL
jgi:hypothetical protein